MYCKKIHTVGNSGISIIAWNRLGILPGKIPTNPKTVEFLTKPASPEIA